MITNRREIERPPATSKLRPDRPERLAKRRPPKQTAGRTSRGRTRCRVHFYGNGKMLLSTLRCLEMARRGVRSISCGSCTQFLVCVCVYLAPWQSHKKLRQQADHMTRALRHVTGHIPAPSDTLHERLTRYRVV